MNFDERDEICSILAKTAYEKNGFFNLNLDIDLINITIGDVYSLLTELIVIKSIKDEIQEV